jgi:hypothetical protein
VGLEGVNVERLERIAGRLAHAVSASELSPEQTPEELLESASLIAELANEVDALRELESEPEPTPTGAGSP